MYGSDTKLPPENAEVSLVEEILNSPDLRFPKKGHRTRDVLRLLLDLYRKNPNAAATEDEVANVVYGGPDELGDSNVRRAISRTRERLQSFCNKLDTGRALRVRIPKGQYRLEFYNEFLRFGVPPIHWFWRAYLKHPEPISIGFATPASERFALDPDTAVEMYRHFASLVQAHSPLLPEVLEGGWNTLGNWEGSGGDLIELPAQTIAIALPPFDDYLFPEVWKGLPASLAMRPFRDPLGKFVVSDPLPDSDPGVYVTTSKKAYVLLTRHNRCEDHECQVTILSGPDGDSIEQVSALITSNDTLFDVVTSGELGSQALPHNEAPENFQILFEVSRSSFPEIEMRFSRVFHEPPPPDDWGPG